MVTKGDRRKNYHLFLYKVLDEEKTIVFSNTNIKFSRQM